MALTHELLLLLARVVPEFLRLAAFYTGNHKDALAAQQKLDREPFYVKLHQEFTDLDDTLCGWDSTISIPDIVEQTLMRVLDVLESRFIKLSVGVLTHLSLVAT